MTQTQLHPDIQELLLSEEKLQRKIRELGKQISEAYAGKNPLLVGVLKGSVHFFADLAKAVTIPCEYDFAGATSYGASTESSGQVQMTKDLATEIAGRHVLLVDDIIDTGWTLQYLLEVFGARNPASIKTCVLLDKPERRRAKLSADYVGFEIPNCFVVGYGLDYQQQYRNLPYIGILKPKRY